jgi:hypothetical protein
MKKLKLLIPILLVLLYSVAHSARVTSDLVVLYDFTESSGTVLADKSSGTPKLDLTITGTVGAYIEFLQPGVRVKAATLVKTNSARTKLDVNTFFTNGITIEAWLKPLNNTQSGPARIISFSVDSANRNFTFGQDADHWNIRFRTSLNPGNGTSPITVSPVGSIAATPLLQHVVYTRDASGNTKIYIDKVEVGAIANPGDGSNWDMAYGFGLFNELSYPTDVRTWLGDMFLVAVYSKNLTPAEITANYDAGLTAPPPIPPDPITKSYKITTTLCDSTTKVTNSKFDRSMSWSEFMNHHKDTDDFVSAPNTNPATKSELSGMYLPADPSEVIPENVLITATSEDKTRTIKIYKSVCTTVFLE